MRTNCDLPYFYFFLSQKNTNTKQSSKKKTKHSFPFLDTATTLPYLDGPLTARVLNFPMDGNQLHDVDPRTVCYRVIKRLRETGFALFSAFEYEFQLFENYETMKPLWVNYKHIIIYFFAHIFEFVTF